MTTVESGSRKRRRRPVRREPDTVPGVEGNGDGPDYPAQDWSAIAVESTVIIIPPDGPPYLGRVDAKTPDSAIVWVVSLAGTGRQMHGNRDGVSLRTAEEPPS